MVLSRVGGTVGIPPWRYEDIVTVYSAQGSQYEKVHVHMDKFKARRNLPYTAVELTKGRKSYTHQERMAASMRKAGVPEISNICKHLRGWKPTPHQDPEAEGACGSGATSGGSRRSSAADTGSTIPNVLQPRADAERHSRY